MIPTKFDLLVAGEINPDLILTDANLEPRFGQQEIMFDEAAITIGSSNAIFACGAARLGLRVAIVGVVGKDIFGSFMLESLRERGVDVSAVIVDPNQNTGFSVILNRIRDRAILTFTGAINALCAEHVKDDLLRKARHLHVASYFLQTCLQPGLPDLFRRARQLGLTTSLDSNWDPDEKWSGVHELLPLTDIFLPNESEAIALTSQEDPVQAAEKLASQGNIIAIKMGAAGAIARYGEIFARSGSLRVEVADTVGAGDSFDAGFIYGYLHGWPLEKSLELGVACGSLSTRVSGGTEGQPTLEEAFKSLSGQGRSGGISNS